MIEVLQINRNEHQSITQKSVKYVVELQHKEKTLK